MFHELICALATALLICFLHEQLLCSECRFLDFTFVEYHCLLSCLQTDASRVLYLVESLTTAREHSNPIRICKAFRMVTEIGFDIDVIVEALFLVEFVGDEGLTSISENPMTGKATHDEEALVRIVLDSCENVLLGV